MNVRITPITSALLAVSALALAAIGACAGQVVTDGNDTPIEGDAGPAKGTNDGAPSTSGGDDGGVGTPTPNPTPNPDGGSPTFIDAGPPATIGGGEDAGESDAAGNQDAGLPAGDCNVLNDCPYGSEPGVSGVACTNHVCVITCSGDNYDINGLVTDGCELANPCPNGNGTQKCPVEHTTANATDLGSFSCNDGDSAQNDKGSVPSDDRAHNPAVVSFDGTAGAAPTVFHLYASGGLTCEDDLNLDLQMNSSSHPTCYSLVAQVVGGTTYTCAQTDGSGLCQILNSSGSYSDGSDIYIIVSKLDSCAATETDDGAFTITGHL